MTEHTIRLRGGWDWDGAGAGGRVSLPLPRPPGGGGPVRLVRRFQAPPIDPRRESLWLRLGNVPGLLSVTLNGRDLGGPPAPNSLHPLPPEALRKGGNRLELVADLPPGDLDPPWGEVALVVRQDGPAGGVPLGGSGEGL